MKTHKFQVILAVIIGDLLSCEIGHAQDTSALIAKFTKVDGHYEYNQDGVPVLDSSPQFCPQPVSSTPFAVTRQWRLNVRS